ncbi:MAG: oligoendopeptidase F [Chloroflexi bacterium RBG_16_48_8]|nr:MAG: oligoendopeptidase F [Chloroflexi bacterium RBG_16_48_8]
MPTNYQQEAWSLDDLFPGLDSPEVNQAFEDLENHVRTFEAYRSKLSNDIDKDTFLGILKNYEAGLRRMARLYYYSYLEFSADTQNQVAQTFFGRVQQLTAELDNKTMFFKLWWKELDDEHVEKLMDWAGEYAYWFEVLRLQKPHTLSEPEEKIINLKDVNGSAALVNLYSSLTNRYTFELEVEGEKRELTRGELSVYVRHPAPDLRERSYKELHRVYKADSLILGQIYQNLARDWGNENVQLRGYGSPIAVRNLSNNIPDDVVESLLKACRENVGIFQRFFRLKAKWIGMEKLRRYDIYAPVVETEKTYAFNDAIDIILESFQAFDGQFVALSKRVLDQRRLDSEVRKGKRSGAFCAPVTPDLTPWVLTSYQGKPDDVATLAHELGHAIHALLSSHQTALTYDASLPLAEVASTFGEMLVVDNLLLKDPDPEVQRDLLFSQMDNAYATIMRQAYFSMFERTAHDLIHSGASVEDLSGSYLENLSQQFGDSLDLGEEFRYEWLAIPHFYNWPFYVYAYAFGQLLVLSLYQQYRQEGEDFKPRYLEILSAGGSDAPVRILERAGVDVRSPDFWDGGFSVLAEALKQLEEIEIPS